MTDPLLTIDEATRAFRTSPKTIRRRLVAGEIDGAYKRPGARGPEWVMPAGSLVAAGFVRRPGTESPELPADPVALAAYWERRAIDAESSGGAPPAPEVERSARRRRILALGLGVLALVALAFLAGHRTAGDDAGDRRDVGGGRAQGLDAGRTTEEDATKADPASEPLPAPPAGDTTVGRTAPTPAGTDLTGGPAVASRTVEPGDSFWSVAVGVASAAGDASPAAVARYWTALVDANADRLVEPDNPDLLHVGQVLVLPPVV